MTKKNIPLMYSVPVDSDMSIANTTSETLFNSSKVIKRNSFKSGKTAEIHVAGYFSTTELPARLTLNVNLGDDLVLTTKPIRTKGKIDNAGFYLVCLLTCHNDGVSGVFKSNGFGMFNDKFMAPTVGGNSITIDTTKDQLVQVSAKWNEADPQNYIVLEQMVVKVYG